jgi:hypothetical protein
MIMLLVIYYFATVPSKFPYIYEENILYFFISVVGVHADTYSETGGPARLPAQVAGRWGYIN